LPTPQSFRSSSKARASTQAFLVALGALLAGYVFMHRSFMGFQMQVAGQAEAAARYAGFSAKQTIWTGLLAGGAMAGIAGMGEVSGPMGQLTEHVSNNYGFAAIIVAFVGRLNPVGIFFASLLMALLYLGGEQAQQYLNLPSSISKVFQGHAALLPARRRRVRQLSPALVEMRAPDAHFVRLRRIALCGTTLRLSCGLRPGVRLPPGGRSAPLARARRALR
jgi:ABC-type uncharacterized transport system permease subunit